MDVSNDKEKTEMKKLPVLLASIVAASLASCGGNQVEATAFNDTNVSTATTSFEETYIKQKFDYATGGKFALSMLTNLGMIAAGCEFASPTTVVSGVFGILNSVADTFAPNKGPTIKNVMDKLNEMDLKIDAINAKIETNYTQLMTETIRTQAMVDQVLLEEMESGIGNFQTNYVVPMANFTRDYADYLEQSYKAYVKQDETAEFYVYLDESKEWNLSPITEEGQASQTKITFDLKGFSHSKEFLKENYDTVGKGFMDAFMDDVEEAIDNVNLPSDLSKDMARDYATANIVERFTKEYYVANHQKALDLRNMAINYANQISGKGCKSITDKYVSRLKYMYNFAGELKDPATGLFANLMYELDTKTALAAQACLYASVNQDELSKEYQTARESIKQYHDYLSKVNNAYCFTTNSVVSGDFYRSRFDTYYTNKGNDCVLHSDLKLDKVRPSGLYSFKFLQDDFNKHNNVLDEIAHLRISTRYNLMKENGLTKAEDYIQYLGSVNAIENEGLRTYESMLKNHWLSNDAYRFYTKLSVRDLNDGDRSLKMACIDKGNNKDTYFNVGSIYNFRGNHDSGCWSGKIAETTYISGFTGKVISEKKVAAYASYNESHWNWFNDEHWSFIDNKGGNYFFILENICA